MSDRSHWERVYETKRADEVSWFAPHLAQSVALIERLMPKRSGRIVDVGGGASTLVDDLLALGYVRPTVVDLSSAALEVAKARLGAGAAEVDWIAGDVTHLDVSPGSFDVWHDRAVFHFLTAEDDRRRYVDRVTQTVRPGGIVIVATFGLDGPERCSGLDVVRYDAPGIHAVFGPGFEKLGSDVEAHTTPWGAVQDFVYCFCRKR